MNGKICKKLKKVAFSLPTIKTLKVVSENKFGSELPEDKQKDVQGKKFDKKGLYTHRYTVDGFVDHYEQLKMVYEKYGQPGVVEYSKQMTLLAAVREREEEKSMAGQGTIVQKSTQSLESMTV